MRCSECLFWYQEDECDRYPRCHFDGPEGWAPCEQVDEYYDERSDGDD